jgi:hypothetical protein
LNSDHNHQLTTGAANAADVVMQKTVTVRVIYALRACRPLCAGQGVSPCRYVT